MYFENQQLAILQTDFIQRKNQTAKQKQRILNVLWYSVNWREKQSNYKWFKPSAFSSWNSSRIPLLNDGAKRNRLLYLKIMCTPIRKILCLHKNVLILALKFLAYYRVIYLYSVLSILALKFLAYLLYVLNRSPCLFYGLCQTW